MPAVGDNRQSHAGLPRGQSRPNEGGFLADGGCIQSVGTCHDMGTSAVRHSKHQGQRQVIGRPQVREEGIPAIFLRHYPANKSGKRNASVFARVCDLSRTTVYKYISLLEG